MFQRRKDLHENNEKQVRHFNTKYTNIVNYTVYHFQVLRSMTLSYFRLDKFYFGFSHKKGIKNINISKMRWENRKIKYAPKRHVYKSKCYDGKRTILFLCLKLKGLYLNRICSKTISEATLLLSTKLLYKHEAYRN